MDSFGDITNDRKPEFQVVLVIECEDGRLFPLTQDIPRCLLPVANRPLLSYQLDLIQRSCASEVIIVVAQEYDAAIRQFIEREEEPRENMRITVVGVVDMSGSADGLRMIHDRITGDFICVTADIISQYAVLGSLVNLHRTRVSDVTMLLAAAPIEEPEKKGGIHQVKIEEEDQELIGTSSDGRVLIKTSILEVEQSFKIIKPILHRSKNLSLRRDLLDMGLYVFSKWVIDFIKDNKKMSSLRMDVIPYIIQRQYQSSEYLLASIPALKERNRSLHAIDSWLSSSSVSKANVHVDLVSSIAESFLNAGTGSKVSTLPSSPPSSNKSSGSVGSGGNAGDDILRCYAMIHEISKDESESKEGGTVVLNRLTNIQSYMNLNRDVPNHRLSNTLTTVWPRLKNFQKREVSVISEFCVLGEKVAYKQCVMGHGVHIGARSKINNSILMDSVVVGDNCVIQNSVVCAFTVIESNCNINDCFISNGSKIVAGTKIKSESIVDQIL